MDKVLNRNLDGIYFRVKRDDKWQNVCFSDLSLKERDEVCRDRGVEWYRGLAYHLADCLIGIGEIYDLRREKF